MTRRPDERVQALSDFLRSINIKLSLGQTLLPQLFNGLMEQAGDQPIAPTVSEAVLRTQAQAIYDIENIGHFGLNLGRYAHFTSPIRRYADLTVHRALISALKNGKGRPNRGRSRSTARYCRSDFGKPSGAP